MTGRYSWRQGFYFVGGQGQAVNESFTMLPEVLKAEGGYHTVAVGKCALTAAAAGCCWLLLLAGDTQFAHSLARSLAMVHMPMLMSMPMPMPLPLTICCHMQRHSVNRCLLLYEQSFRAGCTCRLMHHHRWNIQ